MSLEMKRELGSLWLLLASELALVLHGDRRGHLCCLNIVDRSPLCNLERRDLA